MKLRLLALTIVTTVCLAAPAAAGTNKFGVPLKSGGILTFEVKTNKKGNATKVTAIKVANAGTKCTDGAPGPSMTADLGSARIRKSSATGTLSFNREKEIAGVTYMVDGELKSKKGRKVAGSVSIDFETERGLCNASSKYSAKRN